jgi:predicted membrane protein
MRRIVRGFVIAVTSLIDLLIVAVAVLAAVFHVHVGRGIGERTYAPTSVEELRSRYELGIGDLTLDLTAIRLPVGETALDVRVDVGEIEVLVPPDVAIQAHGRAKAGRVELLGAATEGYKADYETHETGQRVLVLDASTGAGSVRVERVVR